MANAPNREYYLQAFVQRIAAEAREATAHISDDAAADEAAIAFAQSAIQNLSPNLRPGVTAIFTAARWRQVRRRPPASPGQEPTFDSLVHEESRNSFAKTAFRYDPPMLPNPLLL